MIINMINYMIHMSGLKKQYVYHLVMTNIAMENRWPIEMDDFPSYKPSFIRDFPWLC